MLFFSEIWYFYPHLIFFSLCLKARRAFRALKGIIRLQALIRGHLVRRQAVATLRCMRSIVKFQALARGRRVRLSNTEVQQLKKCRLHEIPVTPHRIHPLSLCCFYLLAALISIPLSPKIGKGFAC